MVKKALEPMASQINQVSMIERGCCPWADNATACADRNRGRKIRARYPPVLRPEGNIGALASLAVIKLGDEAIGSIGASGAPGAKLDDGCAHAGLDKIRDQLK